MNISIELWVRDFGVALFFSKFSLSVYFITGIINCFFVKLFFFSLSYSHIQPTYLKKGWNAFTASWVLILYIP